MAAIVFCILQQDREDLSNLNDLGIKSYFFEYEESEFRTIDSLSSFRIHFWGKRLLLGAYN